jgi:hypothetical protein
VLECELETCGLESDVVIGFVSGIRVADLDPKKLYVSGYYYSACSPDLLLEQRNILRRTP